MRKSLSFFFALLAAASAWAQKLPDNLVPVEGGIFKDSKSNYYGKSETANPYIGRTLTITSFYIGKYEVTQKEWAEVMGSNPSKFRGDRLPVETVTWYDCVAYCNKRSAKEGLEPYYNIDKQTEDPNNRTAVDDIKWTVTINAGANGYRLPTETEWEYAAGGGQMSKSRTYSGSNDIDKVAWSWSNAGDKPLTGVWSWPAIQHNHDRTHPVGRKAPNELGLYDMSGNVREWCWNWYGKSPSDGTGPRASSSESGRVWRGGGWMGGDFCCASSFRASFEANGRGPDQGLRVCRNE